MSKKVLTTDEATKLIVGEIESAILRLHESYDFQVEVTNVDAPAGQDGVVEFRETVSEREWYIAVQVNSDPTWPDGRLEEAPEWTI